MPVPQHVLATGWCCLSLLDTLGTTWGEKILCWADLIQKSSPTSFWEQDGIWGNLLWALDITVCPIICSEILLALFNHSHRENAITKCLSRKSILCKHFWLRVLWYSSVMQDVSMHLKTARFNTSKNTPDGYMEGHQNFFFIKKPDMVNGQGIQSRKYREWNSYFLPPVKDILSKRYWISCNPP